MPAPTIVVLLGDPRLPDRSKPGGRFTPDDLAQVERLKQALADVADYRFDYWNDHGRLLDDLRQRPPDFALNFCDTGYRNEARLELHVAALLEMTGVDFSGSGPVTLGLCYDKAMVRAVAQAHGVPVPWEVFLRPEDPLPELDYPAFMKPNRGDGSVGITADSIVEDALSAQAYLDRLRSDWPGEDVIVQEFLSGAEYGVGLVGNPGDGFVELPVLEVDYDGLDPSLPRLLDYGSKTDPESPYWTDVAYREARMEPTHRNRVVEWSKLLFSRLGIRDYGRFDFRSDTLGQVKLMEVNPNPAWCWDGKLGHMASLMGEPQSGLLRLIIRAARRRCGKD